MDFQIDKEYIRDNSIYTIVDGPTWGEAEANANKLGGHLVTINDAEENQWLVDNFPHETSWYTYWIGLNDAKEDNVYQWSSGENFIYSNWRPTSGPNRDPEDKSSLGASYVEFQVNDLNESKAGQWNDHPPNHPNSPVGIAEIPFVRRGDSAYVIVEGPTWEEAEANANKLGGHLVTINDEEENEWVAKEFSQAKYGYQGDNNPGDPDIITHFWLGGTDKNIEGNWEWSSGEDWSFDYFLRDQPIMPMPNNQGDTGHDYLKGHFNVTAGGGFINGNGIGTYYWDDDKNHPLATTRGMEKLRYPEKALFI